MTRPTLLLLVVLGLSPGCGGSASENPPDPADASSDAPSFGTFDEELPTFRTTYCDLIAICAGQDRAQCEADVTAGMANAKAQLDEAGEVRCARCMDVRTAELAKIVAAGCNHAAGDAEAVFSACDLDPTVDSDGDDNPGNDASEACAGFP